MRFEAAYRAGIGSSSIHRPQRAGFVAIQRCSWLEGEGGREEGREGGLKHGGLLEELLALLFCVKPVGGGTS